MKQLGEFNTLADAQAYSVYKMIGSGSITAKMLESGVFEFFEMGDHAIKRAFMSHINRGDPVDLAPNSELGQGNLYMLNELKLGYPEYETQLDSFVSSCDTFCKSFPYADKTQEEYLYQYNMTNKIYTAKTIPNWQGQDVAIELLEDLPVQCAVTSWIAESGFQTENAGRSKQIKSIGKYRLNMAGVRLRGDLELRIPFENVNFNVSV